MKLFKLVFAVTLILCSSYGFAVDVSTAADLAEALTTSPAGTTVTLGADIDCTGWTTVDSFSGTLDGKGYKIGNLDAPLFGTITGDIAISNLVVNGANVTATVETCGILLKSVTAANLTVENVTFTGSTLRVSVNKGNMGFVVGLFSVTGTASFKDCHVDDTCSFALGVNQHGGIAGNGTAAGTGATISFTHCTMAAALSTVASYGSQFGGIAGNLSVKGGGRTAAEYAHLIVEGCTNYSGTGSATWNGSNRSFGGIVHTAGSGTSTQMADAVIRRCANYGSFLYNASLSSSGTNYGGLLGGWSNGKLTMEDCVNYGSVISSGSGDSRSEIGGLLGFLAAPIQVEVSITGCANSGDITGFYAGGLVGTLSHNKDYVNTKILIRSCMNTGTVTARKEGCSPGEAIGTLKSGVAYSRIDIEGGLYKTNAIIGTYAEGASVIALNTGDNVYLSASDGLVDGTDLATLNAYNDNSSLWKQGYEYPILKILPDEAAPDTIVATFKDSDETVIKEKTIARGWYVIPPENPVHEGCTFVGWDPDVFTGLAVDTTFVAQYASGTLSYSVSFIDWDGTPLCEEQTIGHGEAAIPPASPSRDGYVFSGWSVPFDSVTEDLVVQAQYVAADAYAATAAELAELLTAQTLPGVTVHLSADVELPADWAMQDFAASFDGAGYTISCPNGGLPLFNILRGCVSNFVIDASSESGATTVPLVNASAFGAVARRVSGGAVSGVEVENLVVKTADNCKVGFIAGTLEDGARVVGCTIADTCTIQGKNGSSIGGVAGVIERTTVFSPEDGEGHPVTGETLALIADCTNNAPLVVASGSVFCGGIAGNADSMFNGTYRPSVYILRCVNNGAFSATANTGTMGSSIGGILGKRSYNASGHGGVLHVVGCANNADLATPGTSGASIGGIIGYFWRGCETVLDRCVNRGNIGTAVAGDGTTAVTGNDVGGIIGQVSSLYTGNPVTATNCANYGAVTGGANVGGFVGYFDANGGHADTKLMFYNCANYGAIVGTTQETQAGQLFGKFGATVTTSSSRQYGAVNSFFMTKNFYADNSGSAIITNGLVTAVDEKYSPSGARKTLNTAVQENDWEPWVLGRIGEGNAAFAAPELACFMTKLANPGFTVIIR